MPRSIAAPVQSRKSMGVSYAAKAPPGRAHRLHDAGASHAPLPGYRLSLRGGCRPPKQSRPLTSWAREARLLRFSRNDQRRDHSIEMLANLTTLAHFAVSSTRSLPNSSADIGIGVPPSWTTRSCILGSASAAFTALFRVSTTSAGLPFGPELPYH